MKKVISFLLIVSMLFSYFPLSVSATETSNTMENISIGGGGSFCIPMIDPTNPNRFYVTCDMGGLFYSNDRGQTWVRNQDAIGWLRRACISENGTVFAGGCGLYASTDHGQTLNLIYPKNPYYQVSRCGWHENLMLADDYNNGYINGIATTSDKVFFATTDWDGNFRLMYADYDGNNLHIIYEEKITVSDPTGIEIVMTTKGNDLYCVYHNKLWKYNLTSGIITELYSGQGDLLDAAWIEDQFFLLDDAGTQTKILYTNDFVNWQDLQDKNTLPDTYVKWGVDLSFDWHFKEICGNNFDNIYLSFFYNDEAGVMKFNGASFEWVFDSMYKTRNTIIDEGWSYGCHGPFYGICADPSNDDFCLLTNTETVYSISYPDEAHREVHTLHCTALGDGTFVTNGLNVQTTYSVKEDPFNPDHIISCSTDLGLQNSYDNGRSFKRMEITGTNYNIYNTCYDLYFDTRTEGLIYGLWSNRHDAPYAPYTTDIDWTEGRFGVSRDGGTTWDFTYSNGLPADCIPVKMSVEDNGSSLTIAVATFNRGFFISYDSGKTFTSLNNGMDTVEGLIWGEDIVMTEEHIYCLTAPYNCITGSWEPSILYDYNRSNGSISKIDLGELVLVRSLTYDKEKGLYLNVIPSYHFGWFNELNNGLWVNDNGGIYHYDGTSVSCIFSCYNGIFNSGFAPDGTMYAVEPYGKVYAGKDGLFTTFAEGLFTQLKNVSFSSDGDTLYITSLGGGTYRTSIPAPEAPEIPEEPVTPEVPETPESSENTCVNSYAYISNENETHTLYCTDCNFKFQTEQCSDADMDSICDICGYQFPKEIVYNKKTSFTNGKSYLITFNNKALNYNLSGTSITMDKQKDGYQLSGSSDGLTHWAYNSGKIQCDVDGTTYYLSLNSSKKLYVTTKAASAVTWSVSNSMISTSVRTSSRKSTTYYLNYSREKFSVSTRRTSAVLYELN